MRLVIYRGARPTRVESFDWPLRSYLCETQAAVVPAVARLFRRFARRLHPLTRFLPLDRSTNKIYRSAPLFQHPEFSPHPGEIVRWRSLLLSSAGLSVFKVFQPSDHFRATLRDANRFAWRDVANRWKRFVEYAPVVPVEKLLYHAAAGRYRPVDQP